MGEIIWTISEISQNHYIPTIKKLKKNPVLKNTILTLTKCELYKLKKETDLEKAKNIIRDNVAFDKRILVISDALNKCEGVFSKNTWLWYLDSSENLKIDKFRREADTEIDAILGSPFYDDLDSNIQLKNDFIEALKRYNMMFNWLWNHYEIWASASENTKESNEKITERLVKIMPDKEALVYLIDVNAKIDENDYQSDRASSTYRSFTQSLNKKIFEKLRLTNNPEKNKNLLAFANIVSWRDCVIDRYNYEISMDSDMQDSSIAEEALHYVFYRDWWVVDRAVSDWKIEMRDDVVWDTPPAKIVDDFKELVWDDNFENFEKNAKNIKNDTRYAELDVEEKVFIWMLARFLESEDKTMRALIDWMLEAQKEVSDNIENGVDSWFWSVEPEDLWLNSWTIEYEAFELYRDIIWAGYFNPSDTSWKNAGTGAKITWVIWVSIASAVASPVILWTWALTTWVIAWVSSVIAWKTIFTEWHDKSWQAFSDWISDLSLSALLWGLWWKLYAWIKWVSSNMSGGNALQWWAVIGTEATAWAWLELWRQKSLWKEVDWKEVASMAWVLALIWVWFWASGNLSSLKTSSSELIGGSSSKWVWELVKGKVLKVEGIIKKDLGNIEIWKTTNIAWLWQVTRIEKDTFQININWSKYNKTKKELVNSHINIEEYMKIAFSPENIKGILKNPRPWTLVRDIDWHTIKIRKTDRGMEIELERKLDGAVIDREDFTNFFMRNIDNPKLQNKLWINLNAEIPSTNIEKFKNSLSSINKLVEKSQFETKDKEGIRNLLRRISNEVSRWPVKISQLLDTIANTPWSKRKADEIMRTLLLWGRNSRFDTKELKRLLVLMLWVTWYSIYEEWDFDPSADDIVELVAFQTLWLIWWYWALKLFDE